MNRLIRFTFIVTAFFTSNASAQITITDADLPAAGDTFRVSSAPLTTVVDLTITGANQTWDFSALAPSGQTVDSFIPVSATGLIYSFFFVNSPVNPNRSNIVQRGPDITAVPQLQVTDVYNFYYMDAAQFRQVGIGANLNGIPTPVAFGNKDIIYNFPVEFGDQDSSDSDYGLSVPGMGTYAADQKRVNNVDGWGTVITPYGSFSSLRVVAELTGNDSLYLDTLGMGFMIPRPVLREYKWLAPGEGIPVLQINTQVAGPTEAILSIRYKDSLITTGVGVNEPLNETHLFSLSPNPSAGKAILKTDQAFQNIGLRLISVSGKMIASASLENSGITEGVNLEEVFPGLKAGIYLLELRHYKGSETIRWVRNQ
jgi:hypothetical protein